MNTLWRPPPKHLNLAPGEVHVWLSSLDCPPPQMDIFMRTINDEERDRAARFHFQKDRDHFIAARGVLRDILSRYLGIEPHRLRFQYSNYGKPSLAEQPRKDRLCFNISHSRGLALFGLTCGREIGVDLEYVRSGLADEQIAERFFSTYEVRTLRALPKHLQNEAFFNCWTRKEAYIKARGEGLSLPLHLFDVSLVPGEPAALLSTRVDEQESSHWMLRELFPADGFVGAVAAKGLGWELKCFKWQAG